MALSAKIEGSKLTLIIDLESPTASKSGKTLVVASTHGNVTLHDVKINGKPLTIGLNAYISR